MNVPTGFLSEIKSMFPQGKPEAKQTATPLPTTMRHDDKRNKLIIEVDLAPLATEPQHYAAKNKKGTGYYVLAGLANGNFAVVTNVGGELLGLKVSQSGKSNISFSLCDADAADFIQRTQSPTIAPVTLEANAAA